jgi:hypothetical protein
VIVVLFYNLVQNGMLLLAELDGDGTLIDVVLNLPFDGVN